MYSASRKRQIQRERRRLIAAAQLPRETCPAKAQAKAYMEARELSWELDDDPEASFFGASCWDGDEDCPLSKQQDDYDTPITATKKPTKASAAASVSFAPGHATDLETGEDVPANKSGLSWRDWETSNRSRNARADLDAMIAAAEGRPIEKGSDDESESESESDYENSTDESESVSDEEDEDEDEFEEMDVEVVFEKDDDDDDGEVYDERLSSSGAPNDDSDMDWDSDDSDLDSSKCDDDYDSDEAEEDGPEWEFY
ncbi:hypothetical protein PG997_005340 [Apiospora hydei]|uniref:Transcription factor Iwr1 domain-containing protein n=1 Tax=Apiospora hydei TaxID=1337664 RepID=A0ABR1X4V3_9PEZI